MSSRFLIIGLFTLMLHGPAWARGASPYLPLNLSPRIERQIERVLILSGKPVMSRPIAAATVLDALPAACQVDRELCEEVREYLRAYMRSWGITRAELEVSAAEGDTAARLPNRHGQPFDSAWQASASAYAQLGDYVIVNAGGVAYEDEAVPTGTFLSVGFDFAQLDLGYRDHWLSPMNESSSLISSNAPTMPSITLSNYKPLTPLGITYQIFAAEMSRQEGISYFDTTTSGNPRLAGLQLAIEPVTGVGFSFNRESQYGGGARSRGSAWSEYWDALFEGTNRQDQTGASLEEGNRVASLTSTVLFPGKVPLAVRAEYAGEDNAFRGNRFLGATNLTLGLDFPRLWRDFDATFEVSEWQNSWYIHHIYPLGLTHEGSVIGHWFGDNRLFGDAIGGMSQTLAIGWDMPSGDYLRGTYRHLSYDTDWAGLGTQRPYESMHVAGLQYSTQWFGYAVDAEVHAGRDVFGESFGRLGFSFDFAQNRTRRTDLEDSREVTKRGTEFFVDVGLQRSEVREIMLDLGPNSYAGDTTEYHVAVGARRPISRRNDLGARLEIDRVADHSLVSFRALDYRFRMTRKFAVGAFFGAGRYDIELPAYGYYFGAGLQYLDAFAGWDVGVDYRRHEKLTRDKVLPGDPERTVQLPRRVFDITGISLYVSRRW